MEASPRFKAIFLTLGFSPLIAISIGAATGAVNIPALTRDATAVAGINPLVGILSTLGILVWSATAAVWLCSRILAKLSGNAADIRLASASGLLSVYLAADDGFQFHETLAPHYLHISEQIVLGALMMAILSYLAYFRTLLLAEPYRLYWSLGLLGLSVCIDLLPAGTSQALGQWEFFIEDGLKWAGIVGWFAFALGHFRRSLAGVMQVGAMSMAGPGK
jgi:hypothetical protein